MPVQVTCDVFVDGIRLPDRAVDLEAGQPTGLDGLAITWGRASTADQPDVSTLALEVVDLAGGAGFLDALKVGAAVDVLATGQIPTSAGSFGPDVVTDGSFEAVPVGPAGARVRLEGAGTATVTTGQHAAGLQAIRYAAAGAGPDRLILPARATGPVDSWLDLPRVDPGQVWRWSVAVLTGTNTTLEVRPVLVEPSGAVVADVPLGPPTRVNTSAVWQTVTATVTVPAIPAGRPDYYLAVEVRHTPALTWDEMPATWDQTPGTWDSYGESWVDLLVIRPPAVTTREVLVWAGRISDLAASPTGGGGVRVGVTAVDFTADLANRYVGDVPWAAETMGARFGRILTLAAAPDVTSTLDPVPAGMRVSWRDVDSQSSAELLAELATSTDAVLWPACRRSRGGYLRVEDVATRGSLAVLALVAGVWTIVPGASTNADAVIVSSCDFLADPTLWQQSADEVTTRVDVTWLEQTVDDAGQPSPTERTVSRVDAGLETTLGAHRYGVSSQLDNATDAATIADRVLMRSSLVQWTIDGLTWDTRYPADVTSDVANAVLAVLDGTDRLGLPMLLQDLPPWSPVGLEVGLYVEGGTYTYTDRRWLLELLVSPSQSQGKSITWDQMPAAATWDTLDPAMTWDDLYGVGP